jgi:hypothetical protein
MAKSVQVVPTYNLSKTTRTSMQRYGIEKCLEAYDLNNSMGEGAALIGGYGRGSIQRGDAMINAGREMVTGKREA